MAFTGEFGYLCSYFPIEVPLALGLHPVRLLPKKVAETGGGLPSFFCAPARSYLNAALAGHYAHLAGVGVAHACDAMQCLAQVWRERIRRPPLFIARMPSRRDDVALDAATHALRDLAGNMPDLLRADVLAAAFQHARAVRADMTALFRRRDKLAALTVWNWVLRAWHHPHYLSPDGRAGCPEAGRRSPDDSGGMIGQCASIGHRGTTAGGTSPAVRVVIAGSMLASPHLLLTVVEAGGTIAGDDICTGERGLALPNVDNPGTDVDSNADRRGIDVGGGADHPEGDIYRALARHYLAIPPCPCRHPGPEVRLGHLRRLVQEREARGVILLQEKFCEPHRWEQPAIVRGLRGNGTAVLELECEATATPGERERTRVQAFLESLAGGT